MMATLRRLVSRLTGRGLEDCTYWSVCRLRPVDGMVKQTTIARHA
jgi:hypothetical protein